MDISRELAIRMLRYINEHPAFYFPFLVMCLEYSDGAGEFLEVEPEDWQIIDTDEKYRTFQLWENLQHIDLRTMRLMSAGFIQQITATSLETHIQTLVRNYQNAWKKELSENASIEDYGLNEFIEGKYRGYEDCLDLIKFYRN